MGISQSSDKSVQEAVQDISQQYSGSCYFDSTNDINNIDLILKNSNFKGNIDFKQMATVDGHCQIANSMNSTASAAFSAKNSSSASDAGSILSPFNVDVSKASSYQDMRQRISQGSVEKCKMSGSNNMSDILVFMQDSNFKGNILFDQVANTSGECALSSNMAANAKITGKSDNTSKSGKKIKSFGGLVEVALVILLFLIISGIIMMVFKKMNKPNKN